MLITMLLLLMAFSTLTVSETLPTGDHYFKFYEVRNFGYDFYESLNEDSSLQNSSSSQLNGAFKSEIVNTLCSSQLRAIVNGLRKKDLWSIKFIDAWGKIPTGVFYGNLHEMGNFEECLSIKHIVNTKNNTENHTIKGKYCTVHLPMGQVFENSDFKIGICMPATCSEKEIDGLIKQMITSFLNFTESITSSLVQENSCSTDDPIVFDALDWVAIGVLVVIALLMISNTIYDYHASHVKTYSHPLLVTFSVRTNLRQLFHVSEHKNMPHIIPCLHGIRSISIIWIIYVHCFMYMGLSPNINGSAVGEFNLNPFSVFLLRGSVAVDTFFFLSGFLLILVALRHMDRNSGRLNVLQMYLHRYLRLTPILALAVLLFMSLSRYMGDGPIWNDFNSKKICSETWWATLLYVQNYVAPGNMCFGHSWYLAVDMQLFVLSPLILIPIWKWKRKGVAALAVIGMLLSACLFSLIVVNDLEAFDSRSFLGEDTVFMRTTYYTTHTRAAPWIVGIIFGYYVRSRGGKRAELSKTVVVLGWILSLGMMLTVLFAFYPKMHVDSPPISPLAGAFYTSLSRIAWPIAVAWVVFACINGYAGPINQFLSWNMWQPMSKLSYSIYIFHLVVEQINTGRIKTNTHFSAYDAIQRLWSNFGITIFVSLLMYLAIESPMVGIDKFLMPNKTSKAQSTETVISTSTVLQKNLNVS